MYHLLFQRIDYMANELSGLRAISVNACRVIYSLGRDGNSHVIEFAELFRQSGLKNHKRTLLIVIM